LTDRKVLLIVTAHPDDETFGCGGTLAKYVAAGVKVYCACATRGEAGSFEPEHMQGFSSVGDMRWAELEKATNILGLAGVFHLGYRDSGMAGSDDNKNPLAFVNAPVEEAAGRVVKVIRELEPQVIITSDPVGGYRHPDHIAVHKATLRAYEAAGDPQQYPGAGLAFMPQKLYYNVFPHGLLRISVALMPLFGQDPHHLGKNHDVDLASVARIKFPVHASIRLSKAEMTIRDKATACYASQLENRPRRRGLMDLLQQLSPQNRDHYMRAFPLVEGRLHEKDLFQGIV
jgi:N-acetyl-1-D-myo-inositol-2-amino-2-deoxy-alpha-D-glucopyranoside deacetylase